MPTFNKTTQNNFQEFDNFQSVIHTKKNKNVKIYTNQKLY